MARTKKNVKDNNKKECTRCEKEKNISEFYSAIGHPFYLKDEKYSVCKECLVELIGDTNETLAGLKNVLRMLDKPFIYELYLSSKQEAEKRNANSNPARLYMKNIMMQQYKGWTWEHSDFDINEVKLNENGNSKIQFTDDEMEQLIEFWGRGFTKEEYEFLQNEFEKLIHSYRCDSYAMEMLFQEAAQQRLTIKKKREKGESVNNELKTLQDLLGSANIKPVQETGANAVEHETFGTLIKKYENERPIPEPDEEWKDVDGIKKYVRVWFLGHLSKMLGLNNKYTKEYEEEINRYTIEEPVEDGDS